MKYFYSAIKVSLTLLLLTLLFHFKTGAQVTIGLTTSPEQAALLQIKDRQAPVGSKEATATTGGLLLPRVELNATDDFTLLPNLSKEQKKDHTGLLVYNVKEEASLDLKKGVYQWDGVKWKMLNKITKTEGSTVAKLMYQGKDPDINQTLTLGIFEFRINNTRYPQFRRIPGSNAASHHWQVNEYSDLQAGTDAKSLGAVTSTTGGSRFDLQLKTVTNLQAGTWTNCDDALSLTYTDRDEVWLADLENRNIYQVQFMFLGSNSASATKTFLIVAQKY
jgi:hypothetical protein